ncbi:MAG: hypothetical protein JNL58_00990 [Planctomyces sp.]|nr:hypothetical protein [Planctomyces sp.]
MKIKMHPGCMAEKWFSVFDDSVAFPDGQRLLLTVQHDSGGVFDTITTSKNVLPLSGQKRFPK